ncbi:hypothetical protein BS47DRAFT_332711 [Hydnum rufescens UP504]|uniref:Uncharacterized protein n=1 Tax=Hydnum rufescens UP504 TaxID=1448309 RepID=A0A9P6B8M0_9AGAM|nr:hypothetical protein BS47DRAFT_332711 [Hydnum rufescens UP504]
MYLPTQHGTPFVFCRVCLHASSVTTGPVLPPKGSLQGHTLKSNKVVPRAASNERAHCCPRITPLTVIYPAKGPFPRHQVGISKQIPVNNTAADWFFYFSPLSPGPRLGPIHRRGCNYTTSSVPRLRGLRAVPGPTTRPPRSLDLLSDAYNTSQNVLLFPIRFQNWCWLRKGLLPSCLFISSLSYFIPPPQTGDTARFRQRSRARYS